MSRTSLGSCSEMVRKGIRLKINSPLLKTGLQRHDAAIDAAQGLTVTDSVLHARLRGGDLPGTCHHLVNEKHFKWVR
ncbi:ABC-three component system protein [Paraburkholderia sp. JPY465]|uniref:ABC-three component system protein n=1 Tax=Paraburkholderia sp. JPY465 TaxID=3042285 RepID=UPI003D251709